MNRTTVYPAGRCFRFGCRFLGRAVEWFHWKQRSGFWNATMAIEGMGLLVQVQRGPQLGQLFTTIGL